MTGPIIDRSSSNGDRPPPQRPPGERPLGERGRDGHPADPNPRRSEYVDGLPDWDLVPAQLIVRRPKKGPKGQ